MEAALGFRDVLGIVMSLLMLIGGFLLNRVFIEIDRLRSADAELVRVVAELRPMMIDRAAFERHADSEERDRVKVWEALNGVRTSIAEMSGAVEQLAELLRAQTKAHGGK